MRAATLRGCHRGIANQQLKQEFLAAFREGPESTVYTPAWHKSKATVAEVINDEFCADDKSLLENLRIMRNAAAGVDVRLQAVAWIDAERDRFAALHEGDRATEIEENVR